MYPLLLLAPLASAAPLHHALQVELDIAGHGLTVQDTLTLGDTPRAEDGAYHFVLHAGMAPELLTRGWKLEPEPLEEAAPFVGINDAAEEAQVPLEAWKLSSRCRCRADKPVVLRYGGELYHPLEAAGEEYQRGFSETPGIIGEQGVYLGGSSAWLPDFGDALFTYSLEVRDLDPAWDVVSQGERTLHALPEGRREVRWQADHPTDEAHLAAGSWTETEVQIDDVTFRAFLREPDPGLVHRYAEATRRYLSMYEGMLPPYPYGSFALVENFWETGYGMPGFTLLGPRVMRFPWVLATSYPHEILHSWWGNSVYVDYATGNWCEGLTTYMADHLLAQQRGEDALYRRTALKKYDDFVGAEDDFPLAEFGARSSAASEAVGYGKSMMLFHTLRWELGEPAFLEAMGRFWTKHAWTRATWSDVAAAFEDERAVELIEAYTTRTGAPKLRIGQTAVHDVEGGTWELDLELVQEQEGEPFPLRVPVAITTRGSAIPVLWDVICEDPRCPVSVGLEDEPLRIDVDPLFDLVRDLDPYETPPALSTVQGDDEALFVLPSKADEAELEAWRGLAAGWGPDARVVLDSEIDTLPESGAWVLGWDNRFAVNVQQAIGAQGLVTGADQIQIGAEVLPRAAHSLVVVGRVPAAPDRAWAWIAADPVEAIPGLMRKLPHYSRYGHLAFQGNEPANVHKGLWEARSSPLVRNMSTEPMVPFRAPERKALAELPPRFDAERLGSWTDLLADPALKGRGLGSPGLLKAQATVGEVFEELGLEGAGQEGGFRQPFGFSVDHHGQPIGGARFDSNMVARIPGSDPTLADQPVLLMAHVDHLGLGAGDASPEDRGQVHPGADDNASGVAVLMELARVLAAEPARPRPILLAVTSAEEVGAQGARQLVKTLEDTPPFACVNLDTVGRLREDKLYVLNAHSAREWRFMFMGAGYGTGLDIAVVPEPLDASDDVACLEAGIPAVQLFTGPHADYHRPTDTPDKLNREGMARVAEATYQVVDYLAGRAEPLSVQLDGIPSAGGHPGVGHPGGGHPGGGHPGGERKVSLGTMPDFAFPGPGVKVQEVREGSPAAAAGIQAGDVILAVAGVEIAGLRELSGALKGHTAGETVEVRLRRGAEEQTVKATLEER